MKRQIINSPAEVVPQALEGLELCFPGLIQYEPEAGYVCRRTPARDKVGVVSGGGAGHEPPHAGFVGHGMLDVAVRGAVFASPTASQVGTGTVAADSGRGVVQIVKNYTGDVLNFTIAGELAGDDAIDTRIVLVDDDLATDTLDEDGLGRRGTAAVITVEKMVGACAEAGAPLDEVAAIGRRVAATSRTTSLALEAGTHPGQTRPSFDLSTDEIELGVGIHGERGRGRVQFADADALTEMLVNPLVADLELARGHSVIAIVNGLTLTELVKGLQIGLATVQRYGQADIGHKTMVDAIAPAAEALTAQAAAGADPVTALEAATAAAMEGARSTRDIIARRGRASYVGEVSRGVLDPGAAAVAIMIACAAASAAGRDDAVDVSWIGS